LRLLQHPCHIMYSLDPYIKLLVHDVGKIVPFSMFSDMNYFPFSYKTSWICREYDVQLQERGSWDCHEWTDCFNRRLVQKSVNGLSYSAGGSQDVASHVSNPVERVQVQDNVLIVCQTKDSSIKPATRLYLAGISVLRVSILLPRCATHEENINRNFSSGTNFVVSWLSPDMFQVAFCCLMELKSQFTLLCKIRSWKVSAPSSSTSTSVNACKN